MKHLIIYDNTGKIFLQYSGTVITEPVGIPYIVLEDFNSDRNSENYREIMGVDITKEPHEVVYGLTNYESKIANMTLDEYKEFRQNENKEALATFLNNNPLLWTDGFYYGVTEEDQNEMNVDFSIYQFKQSIGDNEWKLQWHSIKSACRDFTIEEFGALLNAIVEFVYPYRQLEMQYKKEIFSATSKEDISAIKLTYELIADDKGDDDIVE